MGVVKLKVNFLQAEDHVVPCNQCPLHCGVPLVSMQRRLYRGVELAPSRIESVVRCV